MRRVSWFESLYEVKSSTYANVMQLEVHWRETPWWWESRYWNNFKKNHPGKNIFDIFLCSVWYQISYVCGATSISDGIIIELLLPVLLIKSAAQFQPISLTGCSEELPGAHFHHSLWPCSTLPVPPFPSHFFIQTWMYNVHTLLLVMWISSSFVEIKKIIFNFLRMVRPPITLLL